MGEDDPKSCAFFKAGLAAEPTTEVKAATSPLPWGGNVFGIADLSYLASIARPRLVGLIGPHNAGKTTLLATLYLLLHGGYNASESRFSRSLTLGGWEAIASNLRFDGKNGPSFPAHTTMREGRVPGLLHFGFRTTQEPVNDIVIADSPGEWFRRWAIDENASDVQGARWVAQKSDGFVVVVDSEALASANSGQTLNIYQQMLERLKKHVRNRPIHIVWTKSDIEVPNEIRSRLNARVDALYPGVPVSTVTVKSLNKDANLRSVYMSLIGWMQGLNAPSESHIPKPRSQDDPFLSYR